MKPLALVFEWIALALILRLYADRRTQARAARMTSLWAEPLRDHDRTSHDRAWLWELARGDLEDAICTAVASGRPIREALASSLTARNEHPVWSEAVRNDVAQRLDGYDGPLPEPVFAEGTAEVVSILNGAEDRRAAA